MICPLCQSESSLLVKDKKRHYYECSSCTFVFVHSSEFLTTEEESARYRLHNNSLNDPRYHQYLGQVCDSFIGMNPPGKTGVDIGCGETTLLADLFKQKDYDVLSYDPLFYPDQSWTQNKYDFFTLSEVIEHLHEPIKFISSLKESLLPGGKIIIKTEFIPNREIREFNQWYYKGDDTHVHFYNEKSATELATQLSMGIEFSDKVRGIFSLIG